MGDTDGAAAPDLENAAEGPDQLAASARGWHRIQLAVLGFIGFCGIFWDGDTTVPAGMQWLPAALVAVAFVLAILAISLVGRVAYPIPGVTGSAEGPRDAAVSHRTRRLATGIRVTYVALALVVAATFSAWWPGTPDGDGAVVLGDATGQVWCGHLLEAPAGEARLATADGPVAVGLDGLVLVRPVAGC